MLAFSRSRMCVLFVSLFATLPSSASAQECTLEPDGLDDSCCSDVTLDLPDFPLISVGGAGLCISNCSETTTVQVDVLVEVASPSTTATCTQYVAPIAVRSDPGGADLLTGSLTMDYSRTWMEIPDEGSDRYQVWRFVVKVDLATPLSAGAQVCPVPNCIPEALSGKGYDEAFFYGYVDYARRCPTGEFESVLVLFHNCDLFIHGGTAASLKPDDPTPFHRDTKYAVVAPRAGFVRFDQSTAVPGWEWTAAGGDLYPDVNVPYPMPGGMRTVPGSTPVVGTGITCGSPPTPVINPRCSATAREPIDNTFEPIPELFPGRALGGAYPVLPATCDCVIGGGTQAAIMFLLGGTRMCNDNNSSFVSLDVANYNYGYPWVHNHQVRLGKWTGAGAAYPGNERVYMSEGFVAYYDACRASGDESTVDFFYGVYTRDGFALDGFPLETTLTFFDAASNYSVDLPLGTYVPQGFVGCVSSMNVGPVRVSTTNHVIGAVFGPHVE